MSQRNGAVVGGAVMEGTVSLLALGDMEGAPHNWTKPEQGHFSDSGCALGCCSWDLTLSRQLL